MQQIPKIWRGENYAASNTELLIENGGDGEQGNSSRATLTFKAFDTRTREDQVVHIIGDWEHDAAIRALRWAADVLEGTD